jgi:uncharacterized protein
MSSRGRGAPTSRSRSPAPARRGADGAHAEALAELGRIYAEADALFAGWTCGGSTDCCRFGITGREPYPTAVERAMLERAVRARGGLPKRRTLPTIGERRCALLSDEGRCLVYAARPFGCRTFFCERGRSPLGEDVRSAPRGVVAALGRRIADLSARFAPADPGPRPLSRATATWDPGPRVR